MDRHAVPRRRRALRSADQSPHLRAKWNHLSNCGCFAGTYFLARSLWIPCNAIQLLAVRSGFGNHFQARS